MFIRHSRQAVIKTFEAGSLANRLRLRLEQAEEENREERRGTEADLRRLARQLGVLSAHDLFQARDENAVSGAVQYRASRWNAAHTSEGDTKRRKTGPGHGQAKYQQTGSTRKTTDLQDVLAGRGANDDLRRHGAEIAPKDLSSRNHNQQRNAHEEAAFRAERQHTSVVKTKTQQPRTADSVSGWGERGCSGGQGGRAR